MAADARGVVDLNAPHDDDREQRRRQLREEHAIVRAWQAEGRERELAALDLEAMAEEERARRARELARTAAEEAARRAAGQQAHRRVLAAREAEAAHALRQRAEEEEGRARSALLDARAEQAREAREQATRAGIARARLRAEELAARASAERARLVADEQLRRLAERTSLAREADAAEDRVRRLEYERAVAERAEEERRKAAEADGARLGILDAHRRRLAERGASKDDAVRRALLQRRVERFATPFTVDAIRVLAHRMGVEDDGARAAEERALDALRELMREHDAAAAAATGDATRAALERRVEAASARLGEVRARRDVGRAHALVLLFANAVHGRIATSPTLTRAARGDVALAAAASAFAQAARLDGGALGTYLRYLRELVAVAEKHELPEFDRLFPARQPATAQPRAWRTTFGDEGHREEYATRLLAHMDEGAWGGDLVCPAPGEFQLSVAQRTVDYVYGAHGPPMRRKITMRRPGMGKTLEMLVFFRNAAAGPRPWPPMLLAHAQDNLEKNFQRELDAFAAPLGLPVGLKEHIQYLDYRASRSALRDSLGSRLREHFHEEGAFIAVDEAHHMVALGEEYRRRADGASDPTKQVSAWLFAEALRAAPARNVLLASGSILSDDAALRADDSLQHLAPMIEYEENEQVQTYTAVSRFLLDVVTQAPVARGTVWRRVEPGHLGMQAEAAQRLDEWDDGDALGALLDRAAGGQPVHVEAPITMPTRVFTHRFASGGEQVSGLRQALARYRLVLHRDRYYASDDNYDTAIFYAMLLGNETVFAPMVPSLAEWGLPDRAGRAADVVDERGVLSGVNLVLSGEYSVAGLAEKRHADAFNAVIDSVRRTVDKKACTVYTSIPRKMKPHAGHVGMRDLLPLVARAPHSVVPKLASVAHVMLALHHRFRRVPGGLPPRQMLMMSATRGLGWPEGEQRSLFEHVVDAVAKHDFAVEPPRYFAEAAYLLRDADGDEAVRRFDLRFNGHCAVASENDAKQLRADDFDTLLGAPPACCAVCRLPLPAGEVHCDVDPSHSAHAHCAATLAGGAAPPPPPEREGAPAGGCAMCALLARFNAAGGDRSLAHIEHVVVDADTGRVAVAAGGGGAGEAAARGTLTRGAILLLRRSGTFARLQANALRRPRSLALLDTDTSAEGINVHNVDFSLLAEVSRNGRQELQKRLRGNRYCKNEPGVVNRVVLFQAQQKVGRQDCDGPAIRLLAAEFAEQGRRFDRLRSISLDRAVFDRLESDASNVLRGESLLDAAFRRAPRLAAYRFALTSAQVHAIWDWLQRLLRECESDRARTAATPCHLASVCPRLLCEGRDTMLEYASCSRRILSPCDGLGDVVARFFHWFRDLRPEGELLTRALARGAELRATHLAQVLSSTRRVDDHLLRRDAVAQFRVHRERIRTVHRVRVQWEVDELARGSIVSREHAQLLLCGATVAHWVVDGPRESFLGFHDTIVGALPKLSLQLGAWLFGIGVEVADLSAMHTLQNVHTLYEALDGMSLDWLTSPYQIVLPIVSTALVTLLWARRLMDDA